jgi:hypothetical protein
VARLPTVVVSSVVRSAHQGESHGGVYLVDLESGAHRQVVDWTRSGIDWQGRGADRGLRGIAFYRDHVLLAASDELFVYDPQFRVVHSYRNRYLKHCHEICVAGDTLFFASTGFDSVLALDLRSGSFTAGFCLRRDVARRQLVFATFDPNSDRGPPPGDTVHLNNVHYADGSLFIAGLHLRRLYRLNNGGLEKFARIPLGSHNARPYRHGVLLNDTASDRVLFATREGEALQEFPVVRYPEEVLTHRDLPKDHARQAFGRGLCVADDGLVIAGSSPSTVSVYRLGAADRMQTVNLTLDVRNSIHGLEVWLF